MLGGELAGAVLAAECRLGFARHVAIGMGFASPVRGLLSIRVHANEIAAGQGRERDGQVLLRLGRTVVARGPNVGDLTGRRSREADEEEHYRWGDAWLHLPSTPRPPSRFPPVPANRSLRRPTGLAKRTERCRRGTLPRVVTPIDRPRHRLGHRRLETFLALGGVTARDWRRRPPSRVIDASSAP